MALSSTWNNNDNIYFLNRSNIVTTKTKEVPEFVDNSSFVAFGKTIGGVGSRIIEYAKTHTKKETYLFNNACYRGYVHKSDEFKDQYDRNWIYINKLD